MSKSKGAINAYVANLQRFANIGTVSFADILLPKSKLFKFFLCNDARRASRLVSGQKLA